MPRSTTIAESKWLPWRLSQGSWTTTKYLPKRISLSALRSQILMQGDTAMTLWHGSGLWIYPKTPIKMTGCQNVSLSMHHHISFRIMIGPVYRVHWLRAKAKQDRWSEEMELITAEQGWTHTFFRNRADCWEEKTSEASLASDGSLACYAARQYDMYNKLGRLCQ